MMRTMSACCLTSWAKLSDMQRGWCCLERDWLLGEVVVGHEWRLGCFLLSYFNGRGVVVLSHVSEFRLRR
jgi:hypothetical protein